MTTSAIQLARDFIAHPWRLWYLVYDNINFTRRKKSERLDSKTEQVALYKSDHIKKHLN